MEEFRVTVSDWDGDPLTTKKAYEYAKKCREPISVAEDDALALNTAEADAPVEDQVHDLYRRISIQMMDLVKKYINYIKVNPHRSEAISDILFFNEETRNFNERYHARNLETVFFRYKGIEMSLQMQILHERGKTDLEGVYSITSKEKTRMTGSEIMDHICKEAVRTSELKGKSLSIVMYDMQNFHFTLKPMSNAGFEDIFLPKSYMDDVEVYMKVFEKEERLLRYLFVGRPGTGKTETLIALTNHLNKLGVTILHVNRFDEAFLSVMDMAEALAPALVIVDDLDLYLGSRDGIMFDSKALAVFLNVLDGVKKICKGVGMIATTNAAHLLDVAAQRPGRFNSVIQFGNLDEDNIINIIRKSVRQNFTDGEQYLDVLTDTKLVNLYISKSVTGAYIYNSVKNLIYQTYRADNEILTVDFCLGLVNKELKSLEGLRDSNFLKGNAATTKSIKEREIGYGSQHTYNGY